MLYEINIPKISHFLAMDKDHFLKCSVDEFLDAVPYVACTWLKKCQNVENGSIPKEMAVVISSVCSVDLSWQLKRHHASQRPFRWQCLRFSNIFSFFESRAFKTCVCHEDFLAEISFHFYISIFAWKLQRFSQISQFVPQV